MSNGINLPLGSLRQVISTPQDLHLPLPSTVQIFELP
jgi:hypothetical protein